MKPDYWDTAKAHLTKADPTLGNVIASYHGEEGLKSRGDAFGTLLRAIVGQQISVKAADSVHAKLANNFKLTPKTLHAAEDEHLRACGLSGQKVKYIKSLSHHALNGHLDEAHWQKDTEELIKHLTQIAGIGRWTAEMFLIFYLLKPDVLPLDDLGLLKAIDLHYLSGERQKEKSKYVKISQNWQPYRTVATWYLWRSLDPVPVEY